MQKRWVVALLAAMPLAVGAQDVQVSRVQGALSVEALAAGAAKSISYRNDKGESISQRGFLAEVSKGRQFTYKRDEVNQSTAFTLSAKDAPAIDVLATPLKQDYKLTSGEAFPSFELATVGGGTIDTAALSGKPTLVHFFFAECVPCSTDAAVLNAYARKHPDVNVLAVTREDATVAAAYGQQRQLAWPVAYAGQQLLDALGVTSFPTMALVGADGRLLDIRLHDAIERAGGPLSEAALTRWVDAALKHQLPKLNAAAASATTATPAG